MKTLKFAGVCIALLALVVPASADLSGQPNLVLDPGFEASSGSPWVVETAWQGGIVGQGYNGIAVNPNGGSKFFGVQGGTWWNGMDGRIYQQLDLTQTTGTAFQLDLDIYNYGTRYDNNPYAKLEIGVNLDYAGPDGAVPTAWQSCDQHIGMLDATAHCGDPAAWQHVTVTGNLPAHVGYATLRIDYWPYLMEWAYQGVDNVSFKMNAVPEPSSLVGMLGALVGMAGFAVRRRL